MKKLGRYKWIISWWLLSSFTSHLLRCGVEEAEAMEKASLAEKAGPTEKPGPVTDEVVEHNAESRDHSGEKENATSEVNLSEAPGIKN